MNVNSYGNTDLGRMRRRNEDSFLDDREGQLYAVADGLGGLSAGDQASQTAITILQEHQREAVEGGHELNFRQAIRQAHEAIQKLGAKADPVHGAGTTLTAALVRDSEVRLAHVGDSAAYLFSPHRWEKLTTDHTEAEEFRKRQPNMPVPSIYEHTLTRCLGQPNGIESDFIACRVEPGDRLFLCTDGVTREISPEEIANRLKECKEPQTIVDEVLRLANERGGADNATAVAIFFD